MSAQSFSDANGFISNRHSLPRMELVFLGTGTSAGVPAIGCDCPVCTSADPRDSRLRTAGALRFTEPDGRPRTILIDCGPDLRQQALTHGLNRADAIFITHNHVDHCWGLDEVRRFNILMKTAIDLYAEQRVLDRLREVYAHIFEPWANKQASFVASVVPAPIEPGQHIDLFGLRITPVRLMHGRLPIVGYRFDAIDESLIQSSQGVLPFAWCTDVSKYPTDTWPLLEGLEHLIADALRDRHHPTHSNVSQAVRAVRRSGASRGWLVHMNHDLPHDATNERLEQLDIAVEDGDAKPAPVRLAYDGLVLSSR